MSSSFTRRVALGILSTAVAAYAITFPSGARATLVEAYAGSLAGATGPIGPCTTFGAPAVERSMFSGGSGIALPGDGTAAGVAACGASVQIDSKSRTGVQSATETLPLTTFGNPGFTNSFSGNAQANANSLTEVLGTAAHGVASSSDGQFNSPTDTFGSEGIAAISQKLTFHSASPDGTAATVRLVFTLHGSASLSGSGGTVETQFRYAANGVGPLPFFDASYHSSDGNISVLNSGSTQQIKAPGTFASSHSLGSGSYSGTENFLTSDIAIVLGTPFDFTTALMTDVLPGHDASADNNFSDTATLSAVLLSIGGQELLDFTGTSDSGALLGPNGVIQSTPLGLPEPSTLLLLVPGLAAAFLSCGRRRRSPTLSRG